MGTAVAGGVVETSPLCVPPATEPTTVLVVDDSAFDRHLVGQLLEALPDIKLTYASNGREGLAVIERDNPAIILTDLIMPDMEGLELVQKVRAQHPQYLGDPGDGLRQRRDRHAGPAGRCFQLYSQEAAGSRPGPTLRQVLSIAATTRERRRILRCMVRRETAFVLNSDPDLILPLIKLIHEEIEGLSICDPVRPDASRGRAPGSALQCAFPW